jgi:hypothetical protein
MLPGHTFIRIEIEDHSVGLLDVVDCGAPGMQFDHVELQEAEQAGEIVDPEPDAR